MEGPRPRPAIGTSDYRKLRESGALYVDKMRSVTLCSLENFTRHWKGKSISDVKRLLS